MPTSAPASSSPAPEARRVTGNDPEELAARERAAHELIAAHLEGVVAHEEWIQTV
jgi:hypothetical protein